MKKLKILGSHEICRAIWAAIDKWSLDGDMSLNVKDSIERSHAVTSIRLGGKKWY